MPKIPGGERAARVVYSAVGRCPGREVGDRPEEGPVFERGRLLQLRRLGGQCLTALDGSVRKFGHGFEICQPGLPVCDAIVVLAHRLRGRLADLHALRRGAFL